MFLFLLLCHTYEFTRIIQAKNRQSITSIYLKNSKQVTLYDYIFISNLNNFGDNQFSRIPKHCQKVRNKTGPPFPPK